MTRNIVLVTADSLRADHCGFLDAEVELTPTLDRLAAEGVVYETALATGPRTPSSMPAAFTGEYLPPIAIDDSDYWKVLRRHIRRHMRRHRTLPERLQAAGYTTIGFSVNPWTENTGFDRGFDRFYTLNSEFLEGYGPPAFRLADRVLRGNRLGERIKWFNKRDWFIRWTDFYDAIVEELSRADEPYFVWLFLLDTHQPYISPATYRQESSAGSMYYATFRELLTDGADLSSRVDRWLRRAYRDSVRSMDGFIERLWNDVESDDAVLVFHSDHGEAFGAHGSYGHEQELYRENLQVPLLAHDGRTKARIPDAISLRRLPEVVWRLREPQGFDPSSVTTGVAVSSTEEGDRCAVGTKEWNLIRTGDGVSLFDLREDPGEERNLSERYPDVVEQLERALEVHHERATEKRRIARAVKNGLTNVPEPVNL